MGLFKKPGLKFAPIPKHCIANYQLSLSTYKVLAYISLIQFTGHDQEKEPVSSDRIAEEFGIEPGSVSNFLSNLSKYHLITSNRHSTDGRCKIWTVSNLRNNFLQFPISVFTDTRITIKDFRTLGAILHFDFGREDFKGCFACTTNLARLVGLKRQDVERSITKLLNIGYLEEHKNRSVQGGRTLHVIYQPPTDPANRKKIEQNSSSKHANYDQTSSSSFRRKPFQNNAVEKQVYLSETEESKGLLKGKIHETNRKSKPPTIAPLNKQQNGFGHEAAQQDISNDLAKEHELIVGQLGQLQFSTERAWKILTELPQGELDRISELSRQGQLDDINLLRALDTFS